ncbi:MAG: hypothetical protein OEW87_14680 [Flavobacteriaceae bacterium]|nr:hypothetical protein [Flavobacteriaceae bacterium]
MSEPVINNSDLQLEHVRWNKELKSLRGEINTFQNKLGEIVNLRTDKEFLIEIAEFENKFIIHKEKINKLQDQIKVHALSVVRQFEDNIRAEKMNLKRHDIYREKIETEKRMFEDLKAEFNGFLSTYVKN